MTAISDELKSIATKAAVKAGAHAYPEMEAALKTSNLKHSRNGDYLGYLIESLTIKLQFAAQDRTMLAEINNEEIEALILERDAASLSTFKLNSGENNDRPF